MSKINHRKLGSSVNGLVSLLIMYAVFLVTGFSMPYIALLGFISYPVTGFALRRIGIWKY